jgi:hypothetical protein
MLQDRTVDGFRLAYDRKGWGPGAPAVLLLHGCPGTGPITERSFR